LALSIIVTILNLIFQFGGATIPGMPNL
jgi:hypothetical protein